MHGITVRVHAFHHLCLSKSSRERTESRELRPLHHFRAWWRTIPKGFASGAKVVRLRGAKVVQLPLATWTPFKFPFGAVFSHGCRGERGCWVARVRGVRGARVAWLNHGHSNSPGFVATNLGLPARVTPDSFLGPWELGSLVLHTPKCLTRGSALASCSKTPSPAWNRFGRRGSRGNFPESLSSRLETVTRQTGVGYDGRDAIRSFPSTPVDFLLCGATLGSRTRARPRKKEDTLPFLAMVTILARHWSFVGGSLPEPKWNIPECQLTRAEVAFRGWVLPFPGRTTHI